MASKWVKIGLKRALFRGAAKIPPKSAHCAGHLWRQNVAVHRISRCFNTSTSGVQRKSKHGKRGKRPRRVGRRARPAGQLFSSSQATQCSYKFCELSILVFTITHVKFYRHPIKLIQGKQPFSPPILVLQWVKNPWMGHKDTEEPLSTNDFSRTHSAGATTLLLPTAGCEFGM